MKKDFSGDYFSEDSFEGRMRRLLDETRSATNEAASSIPRHTGRGSSWAAQGWKHR